MYHDEFFPFYAVYADPEVYDRERRQERELQLMNSWYPQNARELRDHIREECKEVPEELFQVLFWQEISERRCRRQRCQGY